ncbi:hypothetical protein AA0119_g13476 [Alternaria tenuissima]|uniref:Uncharacterized protein n=1 Tax=Alternaria tenuissima TaxID=119927 RepID=A0ABY0FNJ2_9PLEO|nr:hypothetical protein AA0119_g13476 [Alternaria tenuissima]RYN88291.1 hypothetical protein AA0121_g13682 [Alternaria tenuissima]
MELLVWNTRAPAPQNAESSNSNPPARSTTKNVPLDNYNDIFCFLADFGVLQSSTQRPLKREKRLSDNLRNTRE